MRGTLSRLEPLTGSPRAAERLARGVALALVGTLFLPMEQVSMAQQMPTKTITSKQYAQGQLTNKNYKCLSILYGKESAWNWKAVGNLNGKHRVYGIPQGKSEWLKTATPLQQIDWGLRYIGHRYGYTMTHEGKQPNTCKALDHWKRKGWH
jgi:hypothetical protein